MNRIIDAVAFDQNRSQLIGAVNGKSHLFIAFQHIFRRQTIIVVQTDGEDHIYDELRYVCMKNPISPRPQKKPEPKPYDPLSTEEYTKYDRYEFYRRY